MKKFKISQIQFQAKDTPIENANLLDKLFQKTSNFKPDLICTPECSNIITHDKSYLFKNVTYQSNCPILKKAKIYAKKKKVFINIGSLLLKVKGQKKLVNRSILINNSGRIQSVYNKIHLFDVNIDKTETHRESHSFFKGRKKVLTQIKGVKIGMTICYDLRFPNLYRQLAKRDCSIILVPSAFTRPTGKDHWEVLNRSRAIENNVFIVATGMCGNHHMKRKTYGYSLIADPWGNIVNGAKNKPSILNSIINISYVKKIRKKIPSLKYE